ncbi:porin family protein [Epilithonimonas zeae]|uniref:Outer membrane protein beta-barrel domain-containing protein n=1 Tax=Epilithonimonas zeae TaxID=1416779 RepID=A0A1N6EAU0_9FLAO|nr:porin family protein [Epilithonimonas zeae]SIN80027.1 Outer membrane protein beta-barrel domain-containing protein [Epilithonimonas zeae]
MKKIFGLLGLTMISLAYSQSFGVKGGANISTISQENGWGDKNSKVGFYAGLYMNAPVNALLSIQPELIYNNMGVKYENGNTSHTLNLNYVSMPIMFQFELIPKFYVEGGPQFGVLVGNKNKYESDSKTIIEKDKDAYNQLDLSGGVGLGFKFNNMAIGARYIIGFTDIKKNGSTSWNNSDKQLRNSGFQIGLQYGF